MLKQIVKFIGGDPNRRAIEGFAKIIEEVNNLESEYESLSDEALREQTRIFRLRIIRGESLDDILPQAFATVREASKRTIGQRHYDVQIIGGIVLHQGKIAEMKTGEGKTLAATLPLYLNALAMNPEWTERAGKIWGEEPEQWKFEPFDDGAIQVGLGTHLITVNDYLARRDARWMAPIYTLLGLNIGVLQMAARTESGKKAFVVDLEKTSPHEDQHQLVMLPRKEAYNADVTYGTNNEFGFDYLRDNMTMRLEDRVQRGHHYAIIDEVDNVLIDEARTPLIISGPAHDDTEWYVKMAGIVKRLRPEDYEISERDRMVTLSEIGETHVEELLGEPLRDPDRPEDLTPEQARLLGYLEQALRAQYLYKRNKEYLVQGGKVVIVDEFTGRMMPGRRWSDGLHQAVEAKEGVRVQRENVTYATITIQNYFRMYEKLAGMTGTAVTEAEEFDKIYNLGVLAIPTNLEFRASLQDSDLLTMTDVDEYGYKYEYYADSQNPSGPPAFWKRKDYPDMVYRSVEGKQRAIMHEIMRYHIIGRPILMGTTSVENSERLSNRLRAEPLKRLMQVVILRQAWMKQNDRVEDGRLIPELDFLNEPLENLPMADMRKMARDLDITLNPSSDENLDRLIHILDLEPIHKERLNQALQGGISHQVLNARKHTEESQIIAGAGAFGAVTIATNMAGRGVDIKLGGELPEEISSAVNRILRRTGYEDAYAMSIDDQQQALLKLTTEDYGIYDAEIKYFLQHLEDMVQVKALGGLHVIGSERHESRRIDNQLRGRAARQGDPGSSRFYLSMQDDLMRLFGGERVENVMATFRWDESLPMESRLVDSIIESSQTRVEGVHFDTRKHLLEYDDVLNTQRSRIYGQRDRVFTKDDLSEDVNEMLRTEVSLRVPLSLDDPEGPWKLFAWLDQIQPTIVVDQSVYPSYTFRVLLEALKDAEIKSKQDLRNEMLVVIEGAMAAERDHLLATLEKLFGSSRSFLDTALEERLETLDTYFDGVSIDPEYSTQSPQVMVDEISSLLGIRIKLSSEDRNLLRDDPDQVHETIAQQIESQLIRHTIVRLIGAVERRVEDSLGVNVDELINMEWGEIERILLDSLTGIYDRRMSRFIGQDYDGTLAKDLDDALSRIDGQISDDQIIRLLLVLPQGARASFDPKTHRRVWQQTTRLTYVHHAAGLLKDRDPEQITDHVLFHFEQAQNALRNIWGGFEFNRVKSQILANLEDGIKDSIQEALSPETFEQLKSQPMEDLPQDAKDILLQEIGSRAVTAIYRQLLLRVISDLWVDYLTKVEALRVGIGLEAYAQRDPLVQYKTQAFEMFQNLLEDTRMGVVSRMFTFFPQKPTAAPSTSTPRRQPESTPARDDASEQPKTKKKRRRRRRKR